MAKEKNRDWKIEQNVVLLPFGGKGVDVRIEFCRAKFLPKTTVNKIIKLLNFETKKHG
jgi:hypothetical protein